MTLHIDMLYLFFNFTGLRIFFFGEGWDWNNAATSRHHFLVVVVVVVVRVRGGVGGFNSGKKKILSLIEKNKNKTKPRKQRKKSANCTVLLSIQYMDKRPRMNVLQTPGFQYCVYFDTSMDGAPAPCTFRGLRLFFFLTFR